MKLAPLCAGLVVFAGCSGPAAFPAPRSTESSQMIPAAVREACELVASIARPTRGLKLEQTTGTFPDERAGIKRHGCTVSVAGSFTALHGGNDVFKAWHDAFVARGWREELTYSADGPDGTAFAFVSSGVLCLFRGAWDGGDDAAPAATRDDTYRGSGSCAVRTTGR